MREYGLGEEASGLFKLQIALRRPSFRLFLLGLGIGQIDHRGLRAGFLGQYFRCAGWQIVITISWACCTFRPDLTHILFYSVNSL